MGIASAIFALVMRFGGWGLLILGILDSSFLFAPWGNDLLVVALTVRHPQVKMMLYYSLMSTIGSVLGCLLIDIIMRPLGEKGLEKYLSPRALKRVKAKAKGKVGQTLALTGMIPPPFPFTPFVMAASALQYPRTHFIAVIGVTRMLRFAVLGMLALRFGEQIMSWSKIPAVQYSLIALVVVAMVGSVLSVWGWIRRARSTPGGKATEASPVATN